MPQPPVRQMIREAVEELGSPTTNTAVKNWVSSRYPGTHLGTVQQQLIFCSVNQPSRIHQGTNNKPRLANDARYDFLYSPSRGVVELYDPVRHGVWVIARNADGSLCVRREDGGALRHTEEPSPAAPSERRCSGPTRPATEPTPAVRILGSPKRSIAPTDRTQVPEKVLEDPIVSCVKEFLIEVASGSIEIYNEASVQYELAICMRHTLGDTAKVQLERPYTHFLSTPIDGCVKKEIDIAVFNPDLTSLHAIEIKFPRSGQHPEQMFSFCKDVLFLEQLTQNGFGTSWFLGIADDHLFWEGPDRMGIYAMFRGGQPISGIVRKPTGSQNEVLNIGGCYPVTWRSLGGAGRFALVEVRCEEEDDA